MDTRTSRIQDGFLASLLTRSTFEQKERESRTITCDGDGVLCQTFNSECWLTTPPLVLLEKCDGDFTGISAYGCYCVCYIAVPSSMLCDPTSPPSKKTYEMSKNFGIISIWELTRWTIRLIRKNIYSCVHYN
jgi:hypothetical protein